MVIMGIVESGGSPPPVRGKDTERSAEAVTIGITPACAGKSSTSLCNFPSARDHPRLCGEKTKKIPELRLFAFLFIPYSFSLQYTW